MIRILEAAAICARRLACLGGISFVELGNIAIHFGFVCEAFKHEAMSKSKTD